MTDKSVMSLPQTIAFNPLDNDFR